MSILIFAPHPDDEVLITAGIIKRAKNEGKEVHVVVVTNGDYHGREYGQTRLRESINALHLLGMENECISFLGYGDTGMLPEKSFIAKLYNASSEEEIVSSFVGTQTYGIPNYVEDFHSRQFGVPGDYNRKTLLLDIETLIRIYNPDDIYTTGLYDAHGDHSATYLFLVDAVNAVKRMHWGYSPRLHSSIVHSLSDTDIWPFKEIDPSPLLEFPKPRDLEVSMPLLWDDIERVPVPPEMQVLPRQYNEKYKVIQEYKSQARYFDSFLRAFVKSDEFFWVKDYSNIALLASVTVSSENAHTGQLGIRAIDGIADGYPRYTTKEWATDGELSGAWIRLNWPKAYNVDRIDLYDRPNEVDHIEAATLTFSNGSTVKVGPLANNGIRHTVTFQPRLITWIQLTVDKARGANTGLSEIEVYCAT